jgi:Na+/H+-translocating membrane pyrophosphatase
MMYISELISDGAITFLKQEYTFLLIFALIFSVLLYFTVEPAAAAFPYTTIAFLIGALTSIICGYIGMRIAVYTNVRTTKECSIDISRGFIVAYRGG